MSRQCCTTRSKSPSPLPRPSRCPCCPRPLQSMSLRLGLGPGALGFPVCAFGASLGRGSLALLCSSPAGERLLPFTEHFVSDAAWYLPPAVGKHVCKTYPVSQTRVLGQPLRPVTGLAGMCQCASRPRNSRWSELCLERLNKFICKCRSLLKIKIKKVKVNLKITLKN